MDRGKIVAIITGAIALILSITYLTIVQLLDSRGPMIPAPISSSPNLSQLVLINTTVGPTGSIGRGDIFWYLVK